MKIEVITVWAEEHLPIGAELLESGWSVDDSPATEMEIIVALLRFSEVAELTLLRLRSMWYSYNMDDDKWRKFYKKITYIFQNKRAISLILFLNHKRLFWRKETNLLCLFVVG